MGMVARKPAKSAAAKASVVVEEKVSHAYEERLIKVEDLHPGLAQYRRHFDEARTRALAENMQRIGQLDPLIVRKRSKGGYEIVSGERRHRAAKIIRLPKLQCRVRDLTDEQAYEVAIAGNTQREDPHPLEESDGFVVLHDKYGRTAEQIAAKVNRDVGYVYDRLALRDLGDAARRAMLDGRFGLGVARTLSRVRPDTLQAEAVKEITRGIEKGEAVTVSHARRIIVDRYMLRLATAPFDPGDAGLTKAGPCHTCPKNSAVQGKLFGDVAGKGDVCTDRVCWETKVGTDGQQRLARAKSEGKAVMPTPEVAKVFPYGEFPCTREWIDLDKEAAPHTGSTKTWRSVLGKTRLGEVSVTVARVPSGKVLELVRRSEIERVMRRAPLATDPKLFADGLSQAEAARVKADKAKAKRQALLAETSERKIRDATIAAVEVAIARGDFLMIFRKLAEIAVSSAQGHYDGRLDTICERRQIAVDHGDKDEMAVDVLLATASEYSTERLVGLIAEVLTLGAHFRTDPLEDLAQHLLVDVEDCRREAELEIEEPKGKRKPEPKTMAEAEKAAHLELPGPVHTTKLRGSRKKKAEPPVVHPTLAEAYGNRPSSLGDGGEADDTAPGKHDPIAEPAGDDGEDW